MSPTTLLAWRGDLARLDVALDTRVAVEHLPPDLRDIAIELTESTPREVRKKRGLTRGQLRHKLTQIARHPAAAGLDPNRNDPQPNRRRAQQERE